MLTKKDYCDYDTCVALKELGYKVPTSAYYMPHHKGLIWVSYPFRGGYVIDCFYSHNSLSKDVMTANFIDAPTMYEAHKFLREEKGLHIEIDGVGDEWQVSVVETKKNLCLAVKNRCQSYEEALLEGVRGAIKILKEEKHENKVICNFYFRSLFWQSFMRFRRYDCRETSPKCH